MQNQSKRKITFDTQLNRSISTDRDFFFGFMSLVDLRQASESRRELLHCKFLLEMMGKCITCKPKREFTCNL